MIPSTLAPGFRTCKHLPNAAPMDLIPQAMAALRWNLILRVSGQVISWGLTFVVMRLLAPADYGLLAMAAVFLDYASMLADMGISAAVVQAPEIDERKLREAFGVALVMNVGVALLVLAVSPLIARLYGEPQLLTIMPALAVQFLLNGLMVIPRGLAQRKLEFKTLSLIQLGAAAAGGAVTLAMAAAGKGVWALVAGTVMNTLLQVLALNVAFPFMKPPLFSLNSARHMVSFGAKVTGVGLLWGFWSQADVLIGGILLGKGALGAYSIAMQLASMPLSRFAQIVTQVAFPAFSRLQHDPESMRFNVVRSTRILGVLAFPLFWGMSCVAPELIGVAIGRRWDAAVLPLALLALVMPIRLIGQFVSAVVRGCGRADVDLRNALLAVVIMPVGLYVGATIAGLNGLSLTWVVLYPWIFLWTMWNLFRALGLRLWKPLSAIAYPVLAAACMWGVTACVRWAAEPWLGVTARLALLVVSGAAAYCTAIWMLDRATIKSTIKLLKSVAAGTARPA